MRKKFGGVVLDVSSRIIIPFSMIYAVYILAAGEESPGGGFQAGAVLALGIVLARLVKGKDANFKIPSAIAVSVAGLGAFFYVFTGWLSLFNGGMFLQYDKMPFGWLEYEQLHVLGIFLIEAGVTVCVMMTIITILEALLKREDFEEHDD
ncbi:MAG: MnhB domain-containing protein [Eubacterium sp.]|uniref:Multicomponent Na+:H+ antiporter subunit B n=1 Tax=Eubacterium oxidoreducens TaxID=1732 RepID=A0A1G6BS87_EUBOX|nr:MnhB domain-containing protein [Eubacterium oxidoreducens]MCR5665509.1 MnhB domain-containing protein [Eubacterium sp.]SDB23523.1 multicomponent Na+:H+ antiporter subunit B [Eubacterium oxidoreducens]